MKAQEPEAPSPTETSLAGTGGTRAGLPRAALPPPLPLPLPATTLAAELAAWFARHRRDLPWRVIDADTDTDTDVDTDGGPRLAQGAPAGRSPYRVWLSEVMLQQTRVSVVVDYFNRFVARFPAVTDLAAASQDEVLSLWSGLGYYARGRNLHRAAQAVAELHGGRFPTTSEGLRSLPGIGAYTAAAVASLAFGERVAVLDGNVARVLSRLCDDDTPIDTPRGKLRFTGLAQALVDAHASSAIVNEGLMELGALVCTPKSPSCGSCPWSSSCRAFGSGGRARAEVLPVKGKKQARKHLRVAVVVVVDRGDRVWLERRESSGLFGGLWEPPGVVVVDEHDDAVSQGWREALAERAVAAPKSFAAPIVVERTLTHRELRFEVAVVHCAGDVAPTAPTGAQGGWFSAADIATVGTSTAVRAVLAAAREPRLF